MNENIQYCSRCIMDSTIQGIEFDAKGECQYCKTFDTLLNKNPIGDVGEKMLNDMVEKIKQDGKNKKYDCVAGISGGTDSTYTLYLAKKLGLRPLAVHFDNGWNSEIAVSNIKNAIEKLDIDLQTYVVDWEEIKDIQLSFLKAAVPEVEMPTDMGIRKVLYQTAAEEGVKYFISGNCFRAEGLVPHGWGYKDARYIRSVQKLFGTQKIKTFPNLSLFNYAYYSFIKKIKIFRILNYIDYTKEEAKIILKKELGWVDYGGHHHESIYTRFFQSYLAPKVFNMDRRKVTLSAMVRLQKISREDALEKIKEEPYPSQELLREDKEYISKKFGINQSEFEKIISQKPKSFHDYPTYYPFIKRILFLVKIAQRFGFMNGTFQGGAFSK